MQPNVSIDSDITYLDIRSIQGMESIGSGKSSLTEAFLRGIPIGAPKTINEATPRDAFSEATKAVVGGTLSSSERDFHKRLTAQLQRDADEIRSTCAVVRNPAEPRAVTYRTGDDLMAVTRRLCCGQ